MNIFTKVPGFAQQTSKLGSVLQRAFYGSSGRVTLFEQRNFAGRRLDLSSDCSRISDKNFPERCNSVQVESGAWVGYEHENFRGRQYLWDMSERGEYNCYDKWCAQVDHVSSVRAVKQDNNPGRAQLFERAGFSGKKMEIQDDIPNLMSRYMRRLGLREPNYRGPHYILEKRDYNNFSDWGSQNSTVGSMRRVRFT
uniref:Beta/gamma crystallin 'Greek key' domain-containing protein n=1 Tax=Gasterosteus aculeatus aculeatus TaxID=481459 RepID=G3PYZ8_GASAC